MNTKIYKRRLRHFGIIALVAISVITFIARADAQTWKKWFRVTDGGGLKAPITALQPRPEHLDLFVVGNDGGIYSTYHEAAAGWQKWFRIGDLRAPLQSPVTALAT